MSRLALDIDHVGLVGPDIQATVGTFRSLGFRVTEPVELMGTAPDGSERSLDQQSAHFVFGTTYVELSEVTRPYPDHHLAPWLGNGGGNGDGGNGGGNGNGDGGDGNGSHSGGHAMRILILRTANAAAAHERAAQAGQRPTPVGEASRSLHYADGAVARFRWLALPAKSFPEALCGYVQHLTPELVFWPAMNDHPNGAVELTGITLHTPDVEDAERRFAPLVSPNAPEHLHILPAESGKSGFTALHLRTRSLEQTSETLREAGQAFERTSHSVSIEAPGARLIFSR